MVRMRGKQEGFISLKILEIKMSEHIPQADGDCGTKQFTKEELIELLKTVSEERITISSAIDTDYGGSTCIVEIVIVLDDDLRV